MGWAVVDRKRIRVVQAVRILRERKREKLAKLAKELGYSYHYFRYSVLPELLASVECFQLNKRDNTLEWVCEEVVNDG